MDRLRAAIIGGELGPNQRLPEIEMAEKLGCGRLAVRSAFLALEKEGLIVRQPNRGALVRSVDISEAIEITEARMVIEGLAGRKAAEQLRANDREMLRQNLSRMRRAVECVDLMGYSELNSHLHRQIREISRHSVAIQMLEQLHARMTQYDFRLAVVPGRVTVSLAEHDAPEHAILEQNGDEAERLMCRHLKSVQRALRQVATARHALF